MHQGYGGSTRQRKGLLPGVPLARSQSLDAISKSLVRVSEQHKRTSYSSGTSTDRSDVADNLHGPQHLPPLGRKDRRSHVVAPSLQQQQKQQQKQHRLARRHKNNRPAVGFPLSSCVSSSSKDSTFTEPAVVPANGWITFANVFVQAGQAAGIAFRWRVAEAAGPTRGEPAKLAGLSVVSMADGSLAARHGGISPGMMLVEINRERVTGMGQDEMMSFMQKLASQPRVLTLARIAAPPPPLPPAVSASPGDTDMRLGEAASKPMKTKPQVQGSSSAVSISSTKEDDSRQLIRSTATVGRHSFGVSSQANSRPHSSVSSSDSGDRDGSSAVVNGSAMLSPLQASIDGVHGSATASTLSSSRNRNEPRRASSSLLPQRLIALRFVGSRGDTTLFDRDHILGLKSRDIEFVPPNPTGFAGSRSSKTAAQHHRANSQRSLQDMTRDWRNDPFSTPARRRRLINDVCKVIARTYTHASVLRVVGLRREELYATRIQAAFRMRSARRLFCAELEARVSAASVLQLGWLSCAARRRVRVLRETRDHDRREEEGRRKRREDHERRERSRRREEQRKREREAKEKRQQELESAVVLQRRFRAKQEACRRLTQAQRLRDEQHREATAMMQATTVIHAAFRRHQRGRRRREEREHKQRRTRDKASIENLASARLQQAWRRYKAANELNRRRRRELETSGLPSSTTDEDAMEHRTEGASSRSLCSKEGHPDPKDEDSDISKKSARQDMSGDVNKGASGWDNWSSAFGVNPSLAAEIAREGETDNAAENVRPWTSAGPAESPAPPRSRHHHPKAPPPAGMMTVTVRRGSEETSLVTPIVHTESGGEEMEAETTRESEVGTASATASVSVATADSSVLGSDESGGTRPRAVAVADKTVRVAEAKGAAPPARADAPKSRRKQPERTKTPASAIAASEVTKPANPSPKQDADDAAVAGKISQLPSTTAPQIANEEAKGVPAMVAVAPLKKGTAASEGDPPMTVSTPMTQAAEEAARDVVKPTEQLFMEDTQVYLGCGMCGVKYLVEAVDPGVSKSTQAGQPTPEVLYLCTTCGATLRNNGENGRWKRRRRPSSAPASGRRRGSAFSVGGRDGGARANNEYGPPPGNEWNGDSAAALVESPGVVESLQQALHTGGGRRQGENDSATRLRYAHCAKAIQHAYRNFRHRQYLRDWAFSLVRGVPDMVLVVLRAA
ncbi:unnamed protein product [Ectocarpus sp. 12 AP-2014]